MFTHGLTPRFPIVNTLLRFFHSLRRIQPPSLTNDQARRVQSVIANVFAGQVVRMDQIDRIVQANILRTWDHLDLPRSQHNAVQWYASFLVRRWVAAHPPLFALG